MVRIIVVGGSAAGMAAAAKAKRSGSDVNVVVLEKGRYVSYASCGIPYYISGFISDFNKLLYYPLEYFRRKRGIDVRVRCEAVKIDRSAKTITAVDLDSGREIEFEYDKLILATGASALKPSIDGVDLDGIYTVRDLEDMLKLIEGIRKASRIAIVGLSYTGLEIAEALIRIGKRVLAFTRSDHVIHDMDPDFTEILKRYISSYGVELHINEPVEEFEGSDRVSKVITSKSTYDVDAVVLSVGVKPNVELAKNAGLEIGVTGGIKVDEYLRTSDRDIYSVGDNTESIHIVTRKPYYSPTAPIANKMGRIAGENAVKGDVKIFPGVLGSSIVKFFDLEIGRVGLSYEEALRYGFNATYVDIKHHTRSHYYPGCREIWVRSVSYTHLTLPTN